MFAASQRWNATVEGLTHRQKAIEVALPELEQVAALPAASDDDKRAARSARAALKVTQRELGDLRGEYWIAVLEEFGLLPNYTLLDDSVTLEVALTWIDPDTQEYQYESTSLQRSSANALREFAPGSTFYARGLEISIDTVDLGVGESAIRPMAFCPTCGFAADLDAGGATLKTCPRCGDVAIGGIEHHLDVVELTRVSAEMNRDEAQISDRTDERKQERFSIFVAADIDPAGVAKEWYVDAYSFGAKYLSRLDVRWVNAGRAHGTARQLAGVRGPAPLFRLCEGCGKLDRHTRANSRGEHRPWCRYRKSDDEHTRDLALTRTLSTQGAVLRLPLSVTLGDRFALPSLAAAVSLGLQEQIGGLPDHIEVAQINVPVAADHEAATVEALLLHDVVPGGTGYLAELASPERVWDLLYRAWQRLATCACVDEPRLACHRCLLPFASPWQLDLVSRAAAERHLREILTAGLGTPTRPGHGLVGHRDRTDRVGRRIPPGAAVPQAVHRPARRPGCDPEGDPGAVGEHAVDQLPGRHPAVDPGTSGDDGRGPARLRAEVVATQPAGGRDLHRRLAVPRRAGAQPHRRRRPEAPHPAQRRRDRAGRHLAGPGTGAGPRHGVPGLVRPAGRGDADATVRRLRARPRRTDPARADRLPARLDPEARPRRP